VATGYIKAIISLKTYYKVSNEFLNEIAVSIYFRIFTGLIIQ